jgi:hypothetical protein
LTLKSIKSTQYTVYRGPSILYRGPSILYRGPSILYRGLYGGLHRGAPVYSIEASIEAFIEAPVYSIEASMEAFIEAPQQGIPFGNRETRIFDKNSKIEGGTKNTHKKTKRNPEFRQNRQKTGIC